MMLTEHEDRALSLLVTYGALSAPTFERICDTPEASWQGLKEKGLVRLHHVLYGPVIGLTRPGLAYARTRYTHAPYLISPESVANRAYLNDTLQHLYTLGYRDPGEAPQYKRDPDSKKEWKYTHEIISYTVRIPDDDYATLTYEPYNVPHSQLRITGFRPGQPRLYATISQGGISPKQAENYIKTHHLAIKCWQTPLLIAVPDPTPFERLLQRQHHVGPRVSHPVIQLVVMPLLHDPVNDRH